MKSFQKIIQGTKIWLPPAHYTQKFFEHGFRKREKREEDEERKVKGLDPQASSFAGSGSTARPESKSSL